MTLKREVVSELGDDELLAPDLIAEGPRRQDQVKYYFALLQTARDNADAPRVPAPDLRAERIACEIADSWLDDVVAETARDASGNYAVPKSAELVRRIGAGIVTMLACLPEPEQAPLRARLAKLTPIVPEDRGLSGDLIAAITSGDRDAGDSLHLLVMDAHRAINAWQVATASETLAGARVHRLSDQGRRRHLSRRSGRGPRTPDGASRRSGGMARARERSGLTAP